MSKRKKQIEALIRVDDDGTVNMTVTGLESRQGNIFATELPRILAMAMAVALRPPGQPDDCNCATCTARRGLAEKIPSMSFEPGTRH